MPLIKYIDQKLSAPSLEVVSQANEIIAEYSAQGYDLTLRQLYYQFVSRDLLANTQKNYKRLGSIINDARLVGLIDWDHITDRTRGIESLATWEHPQEMINYRARSFMIDKWATQKFRPEVWIEKEALAGVFERVCNELRIPYLSCRGYTSQSEMWRAGRRLAQHQENGQTPFILHFGDHDPSGIDMSRDIIDRLKLFMGGTEFHRLALNMDQVDEHQPPPNPAKLTNSRATAYVAEFGDESWELDALNPDVLSGLVRERIEEIIDQDAWDAATHEEDEHKRLLGVVAQKWNKITSKL